jgi:P2 family phage contractile tail tube protein
MGLPRTLQNLMLFNEGQSYVGEVKTVTLPTLTRKLEEYRGGGMSAPVKVVAVSQKVTEAANVMRHWAQEHRR